MTQTDVPPTRLERAKHKITDLIELRGGGNNALIAYAGSAHIAMPMTQDSAILTPFLQAIEPQVMPVAGKSLASTLPVIESLLPPDSGGSVVLLSDGVNANDIDRVADYFNRTSNSLVILVIGNRSSNSSNPTGLRIWDDLLAAPMAIWWSYRSTTATSSKLNASLNVICSSTVTAQCLGKIWAMFCCYRSLCSPYFGSERDG